MTEGVFPKIDGAILYASEINDNNKNTNICEIANAITASNQANIKTDFSYTNLYSDVFSVNNGYNNSITTGSVINMTFLSGVNYGYYVSGILYDHFGTGSQSINQNLIGSILIGVGSVMEHDGVLDTYAYHSGGGGLGYLNSAKAIQISGTAQYFETIIGSVAVITATTPTNTAAAYAAINFGNTVIIDKRDYSTGSNALPEVYGDLTAGSWLLLKVNSARHNLYKNGIYVRSFDNLAGSINIMCIGSVYCTDGNRVYTNAKIQIDYLSIEPNGSGLICPNVNCYNSLNSAFGCANYRCLTSGISKDNVNMNENIKWNFSSNGGTSYEAINKTNRTWATLNNTSSGLATKMVSMPFSGINPIINSIGYSIF